MDIQNVDDKQFTVTLNAFFVLRWTDHRIVIRQEEFQQLLLRGNDSFVFQYYLRFYVIVSLYGY